MSKICWYCEQVNIEIMDDFFGDFECKYCGVLNSIYDPTKFEPLPPEEEDGRN